MRAALMIAAIAALVCSSGVGCGPKSSGGNEDGGGGSDGPGGGTVGTDAAGSAAGMDGSACPSAAHQPTSNAPCTSPGLMCQYHSAFCTCTKTDAAVAWDCQPII
jgi:hypothetical protein